MEFKTYDMFNLPSFVNDSGYVCVLAADHPHANKGYVLQHRLVMEAHMGEWIDTSLTVHHINEVKDDNRIENLYLCTQEEHTQIHNRFRKNNLAFRAKVAKGVIAARNQLNQKSASTGA